MITHSIKIDTNIWIGIMNNRCKIALQKLDIHFSKQKYTSGTRHPPERDLCSLLNLSRSALREVLEADGQIWRRVGMGTYFDGPPENIDAKTFSYHQ
jgi:DNA-binding FadR family transcriptional regulator